MKDNFNSYRRWEKVFYTLLITLYAIGFNVPIATAIYLSTNTNNTQTI